MNTSTMPQACYCGMVPITMTSPAGSRICEESEDAFTAGMAHARDGEHDQLISDSYVNVVDIYVAIVDYDSLLQLSFPNI